MTVWRLTSEKKNELERVKGVFIADTSERLEKAAKIVSAAKRVGVDTEYGGFDQKKESPVGKAICVSCQFSTEEMPKIFIPNWGEYQGSLRPFKKYLESEEPTKVLHNAKADMHVFANHGIRMRGLKADTMIMDFTYNTAALHGLKEAIKRYFREDTVTYGETFREPKPLKKGGFSATQKFTPSLFDVVKKPEGIKKLIDYSVKDPWYTLRLEEYLRKKLSETPWVLDLSMLDYYEQFPLPYTDVLFEIERTGCPVDIEKLEQVTKALDEDTIEVTRTFMHECVKQGLDPEYVANLKMSSTKQVGELFRDKLGVHFREDMVTKKGQPKTDDQTLRKLKGKKVQNLVAPLLEKRRLEKLNKTYVKPFIGFYHNYKGYVHTTLKQIGTRCMPAGELVLTSRGYLPVENVKIGDKVLTHRGRGRLVTQVVDNGDKVVYKVVLSNGLVLRTTGNHKYKLKNGWKKARNLLRGDLVVVQDDPEEWALIEGWEDFSVSTWGRVRNEKTGRLLKMRTKGNGSDYGRLTVHLYRNNAQARKDGDRKDFRVHRLVADAFLPKGKGHTEVRHLNGIAWVNTVSNLKWGTSSENSLDAVLHGTIGGIGKKLSKEDVAHIKSVPFVRGEARLGRVGSDRELAAKYGVSREMVRDIRLGKKWKTYPRYVPSSQFHTAEVTSVTREGTERTFGLTVLGDHSHVTGGIVTHNTARLSSSAPNLQNIPTAYKDLYGIRGCFVSADPKVEDIADIDLSQIEMRLMAHRTKDKVMIKALREGWDLHALTTTAIYEPAREFMAGRSPNKELLDQVKEKFKEARDKLAKTINFGVGYGMGENKYAMMAGVSPEEGRQHINNFFSMFSGMRKGIREVQQYAYKHGYVCTTILRRRMHLPHIKSEILKFRKQAERQAFNYVTQGGAADLLMMAMILIHFDKRLRKWGVKMVLQVHDELLFRIPKKYVELAKPIIEEYVSHPYRHTLIGGRKMADLLVDTPADMGVGRSWSEAKH